MAGGRMKLIVGVVVAAVVVAALAIGLTRGGDTRIETAGPSLDGTAKAPAIRGKDLKTGRLIDLAAYRGKPVFINVWASWCLPCRKEAPQILRFTKEHPEVVMLGVNTNNLRADARTFNAQAGWTHPSIYDPNGAVGLDQLKVANLPATIYIDANGIERGRTRGPVTYEDLASAAARI